jgi:hypothetical protein
MEQHWLTRPQTIRNLWIVFGVVLAAVVVAELFVTPEVHFAIERVFGFYALFGFASCAVLIVVAKVLGLLLKRPDTYYDDQGDA